MGSALLRGWVAARKLDKIYVVEPYPSDTVNQLAGDKAIELIAESGLRQIPEIAAAVLAMKPQTIKAESGLLQELGLHAPLVLSIAAGVTTSHLMAQLGRKPRVVRAMPNTPGAIGKGITVLYAGPEVEPADRRLAQSLMSAFGEILWLKDEALLDAVTAVSGSGPAYVFLMVEALAAAGRAEGLDAATAERLARFTVSGAGALVANDPRPAEDLRRDVTSPGGTTEAALGVLTAPDGLVNLMKRAVAAATERGKALGKNN
ncbi:MAG: pyrroline-5-carboxylate reductase [Alphaproteobacteria bacterium]|nr:pyrroline-5-carboxylate reductase [Alphaproteobacteria bacterium]